MPKQQTPVPPAETTPAGRNGQRSAMRDRLSMQAATDFLTEDVDATARAYIARHEGVREITRLSIAAGLDDLDYTPLSELPPCRPHPLRCPCPLTRRLPDGTLPAHADTLATIVREQAAQRPDPPLALAAYLDKLIAHVFPAG